jgi:hypothetical protein
MCSKLSGGKMLWAEYSFLSYQVRKRHTANMRVIDKLAEGEEEEEDQEEWQKRHVILFTPAVRICSSLRTINNLKDQFVFC